MSNRPAAFMPLWIGDYLADTTHLTTEQHGAYLLLLMAYWRRGGPLAGDDQSLCRIAGVTIYKWRVLRPIIAAFFEERDGSWISKRADEELAKAGARYEKRAAAGRKGGSAPKIGGRKITYSAPTVSSSASAIAAIEADDAKTAEISQPTSSNALAWLEAGLKQSQSQSQTMRTTPPSDSNPEIQNLVDSLLVRAEPEPHPRPASKAISSKVQRGTRWPADAVVPDDWVTEAAGRRKAHGKPAIDLVLEAEKFRNYWSAKSGASATKIDWRATWRNWALNSNGVCANGRGQFGRAGQLTDHPLGIFGQLGDELREREISGSGWPEDHGGHPH